MEIIEIVSNDNYTVVRQSYIDAWKRKPIVEWLLKTRTGKVAVYCGTKKEALHFYTKYSEKTK